MTQLLMNYSSLYSLLLLFFRLLFLLCQNMYFYIWFFHCSPYLCFWFIIKCINYHFKYFAEVSLFISWLDEALPLSRLLTKGHQYGIPQDLSMALMFEGTSWLYIKSLIHIFFLWVFWKCYFIVVLLYLLLLVSLLPV